MSEGLTFRTKILREPGRLHEVAFSPFESASGGGIIKDVNLESLPLADFVLAPAFTDWHVHAQLASVEGFVGGPIARVLDLGANPDWIKETAGGLKSKAALNVLYAGAFLTTTGGYPSDRDWAPKGSVRQISATDEEQIVAAVQSQKDHGASVIKIAHNSNAGPVFHEKHFRAIVTAAADVGLKTVAHAEGKGTARQAREWGADFLAHTPFSEILDDEEVVAQANELVWLSTLDIHGLGDYSDEFYIAKDNLSRFSGSGGKVLYATDLGNGNDEAVLNPREIAALRLAGLNDQQILEALVGFAATFAPALESLVAVPFKQGSLDFMSAKQVGVASQYI